jgi:hypothetical protein
MKYLIIINKTNFKQVQIQLFSQMDHCLLETFNEQLLWNLFRSLYNRLHSLKSLRTR